MRNRKKLNRISETTDFGKTCSLNALATTRTPSTPSQARVCISTSTNFFGVPCAELFRYVVNIRLISRHSDLGAFSPHTFPAFRGHTLSSLFRYASNAPNPLQSSKLIDFSYIAAPIITCYLVNHSPFRASTVSCHPRAHVCCSDALPSAFPPRRYDNAIAYQEKVRQVSMTASVTRDQLMRCTIVLLDLSYKAGATHDTHRSLESSRTNVGLSFLSTGCLNPRAR